VFHFPLSTFSLLMQAFPTHPPWQEGPIVNVKFFPIFLFKKPQTELVRSAFSKIQKNRMDKNFLPFSNK